MCMRVCIYIHTCRTRGIHAHAQVPVDIRSMQCSSSLEYANTRRTCICTSASCRYKQTRGINAYAHVHHVDIRSMQCRSICFRFEYANMRHTCICTSAVDTNSVLCRCKIPAMHIYIYIYMLYLYAISIYLYIYRCKIPAM